MTEATTDDGIVTTVDPLVEGAEPLDPIADVEANRPRTGAGLDRSARRRCSTPTASVPPSISLISP
ncbi:hypothetical protein [Serinicoccus sp. CUA-874]|uniref:hypothetical protein n=1 Tax=Serinicoccus sp. CUA-874 TaxID=1517939 RepID=UPI00192CFD04|nr:hypothetical protein [Serinicoccus sp. CUA-874]